MTYDHELLRTTERGLRNALMAYVSYRESDERILTSEISDLERIVDIAMDRTDELILAHNLGTRIGRAPRRDA